MMDPDLDEMDFSFSCNKCSFTTKDMVEIKKHMFGHKNHGKDLSQKVAEAGSSQTDASLNNSAVESQDQDKTTPPSKDKPSKKTSQSEPINLPKDTPTSPSPTQQTLSDSVETSSPPDLSDGDSLELPAAQDEISRKLIEGGVTIEGVQAALGIPTKGFQPTGSGSKETGDTTQETGPDTIANRIHSRHRERPTPKKPQDIPEDDDADFIPYKPAKRVVSRMKRKQRGNTSALKKLQVKFKARAERSANAFKCEHCHFVCKFKQILTAHKKGAHPEIYLKEQEKTRDEGDGQDGEEEENGDNELTNREGGALDEAQSHLDNDRYKCSRCTTFFCRFKKDLKEHENKVHGIPTVAYKYQSRIREDRYQCSECDFVCKFQRSLRMHERYEHPKEVKIPEKVKKEKKIAEDRYRCGDCDFSCKFKGQMKAHRNKNHKKERPPRVVREQQCEFCHKFIQGTMHHYKRHLKTHTGDKPYKCSICEAVFGDQSRLNAHAPIHREERNYLCDQCGKAFKRAINLRMHRKVHLVVRPHGCTLCNYRCKRHDTLNLHMKRKHLKIRPILCDTCGKKFFSEKECQLHAARKHLPRPTPFQCTFCTASFPFAYNLRAHMKKHPEHKPFRCEFCTFESRSKASLQDHEKMHTGEKQKKCELCDYTTSTSSNLYKHRKRQHGIMNSSRTKAPRARPVERHPSLNPPIVLHETAQRSLPNTPQPMMLPTTDSHPHLHQAPHQGSQMTSRVQGSTSAPPALKTLSVYDDVDFKDRRQIIYAREKSLIGSVITEALAEARHAVQSELYSGHLIPSTMAASGLSHAPLPVATTMTPSHGGMVPAETIIHGGIPTSVSSGMTSPGATSMFSNMMNLHY
ncbi:uncharacterized protein [Asterias amurensis]|uniref:uncharacterized protein n=1 Tax=Asterias amurensis TaxID=7602 RepID=UPI003AB1BBEA